ncbi:MAG: MTH1187 family thiamine-binding protein [Candidatus Hadarchaeum sp.]|uniref:MTH1187 family thiamine-binding protein n=1 Tax=Candidatus Hadarchaeum sp. TaxID=2883567 RepID=UPI003D12F8BE
MGKAETEEIKMAIMEISVIPLGAKTPSVSKHVADALEILNKEKDIKYELTSMGTIVEGDLKNLLDLAKKMHEAVFDKEILRVVTIIKIDDRRDKPLSMEGKIKSIQDKL